MEIGNLDKYIESFFNIKLTIDPKIDYTDELIFKRQSNSKNIPDAFFTIGILEEEILKDKTNYNFWNNYEYLLQFMSSESSFIDNNKQLFQVEFVWNEILHFEKRSLIFDYYCKRQSLMDLDTIHILQPMVPDEIIISFRSSML
jgi:hypothetical protein